ncbi:zinc-binding dehydrogenase [Propionibacterium australiense]|uniref:Alcohol dehydrogenase GroES-like domain n=1 Tax=Propionibacterium australiense TaxID=119981 RepID=A0A383S599_9ACTN|nr:zinc-binding dehydrogenase [Propionibacterium australiense]RLP07083.1 L-idonate 5-dehydrogenase [Propionibacterium australiense]SYZ33165.1 Alcohol dehydrogenase GroES-like domain [Propionibacterium australiense]VEH89181.1 L-idonate 5-dehydrogenase [Propionibacterium australiense]
MKALKILGPQDMVVQDLPVPQPGPDEVRVRIHYVGICGSDLNYYFKGANGPNTIREPFSFGHEMSGLVDADPSGSYAPGTPITIAPASPGRPVPGLENKSYLWPGSHYMGSAANLPHDQGGAGEYVLIKRYMVRALPESVSLRHGALAEPLAVALHALAVAGGVGGRDVLVSGAGPIGLLVAGAAKILGARSVTSSDMLAAPLERAGRIGADRTILLGQDSPEDSGYDVVFECSGSPRAVEPAIRAARRTGTVCQVGTLPDEEIPVNIAHLETKEIRYVGSFRYDTEIDDAVAIIGRHPQISTAVTHTFPAGQAAEAFRVARDSTQSGKVLVSMWID